MWYTHNTVTQFGVLSSWLVHKEYRVHSKHRRIGLIKVVSDCVFKLQIQGSGGDTVS